ncbi:leucine-rich repeat domain-containing protein [Clostridium baratii]|uniref:leucine-rich repeat domain-containing protein n=1 Tax=Clostridium baratii TaxID=1561 RepID=UPI0030CCBF66
MNKKKIGALILSCTITSQALLPTIIASARDFNNGNKVIKDSKDKKRDSQVNLKENSKINNKSNLDTIINIPDENFKKTLKKVLFNDENSNRQITQSDLLLIYRLDLSSKNITNLEGIQYCDNLEVLSADKNQINDLSPLAKLTNLTSLGLSENQISDITPLANLTNLTGLNLAYNQVSDVTSLKALSKLDYLIILHNQIVDIKPLENLTNLTRINLDKNQINNITPLANLTNLTNLGLSENQISDIIPLANLTNLTSITLDKNRIKDVSPLKNLVTLPFISLNYNQISDITPLANLTNLTGLALAYNQISDITPLAKLDKLEGLYLENQSIESKEVSSKGDTAEVKNNIKTIDGSIVNAINISNGGTYNSNTNFIKWNTIKANSNETYEFNESINIGKTNARFSGTVTQPIKYRSNDKPIINGANNVIIVEGTSFDPMAGVTATDTEDGNITKDIKVTGTVNTNKPGKYELTYTVTDSDGNTTIVKRIVTVNMKWAEINNAPVITAENKTIKVGDKFDPMIGVAATDAEDGNITKDIKVIENTVNTNKPGTYKVVYEITDSQGIKTKKTITVTVVNKNKPVINESNDTTNNNKPITNESTSASNDKVTLPATGATSSLPLIGSILVGLGGLFASKKKNNKE